MYSWEIDIIIRNHHFSLPSSVYLDISDINKNPQIDHVQYNAYSNYYAIWTKDGWYWGFQVYRDKE